MDSTSSPDQADLARLTEKDKAELRQFVANEQKRVQIQSQTHALTDTCWKKCITGAVKGNKLDKGEEGCLANCVDRFVDVSFLTTKHLANMRSG